MTAVVQDALAGRGLVPDTPLVEAGYVEAAGLVASAAEHGIALVGPAMLDTSRHARTADGFDVGAFTIRWAERSARCRTARPATAGRKPVMTGAMRSFASALPQPRARPARAKASVHAPRQARAC